MKASTLGFFCSGTQTMSFLPASFCRFHGTKNYSCLWLLLSPPFLFLVSSALFRIQWLVGHSHPSPSRRQLRWEPEHRAVVQPNMGSVSTGSGWGREGAAAHERQDGAATMDLQFRLCSLIYELEMEGRKC